MAAFALLSDPATWTPFRKWVEGLGRSAFTILALSIVVVVLLAKIGDLIALAILLGGGIVLRAIGRRRGRAPRKWIEDGWVLAAVYLLWWLGTAPIWLPAEEVGLRSRAPATAYVLSIAEGWTTLLTTSGSLVRVDSDDLTSRTICNEDSGRSLLAALTGTEPIPQCEEPAFEPGPDESSDPPSPPRSG